MIDLRLSDADRHAFALEILDEVSSTIDAHTGGQLSDHALTVLRVHLLDGIARLPVGDAAVLRAYFDDVRGGCSHFNGLVES